MRQAASYFLGTHDFRAFSSIKNSKKSTVRTIDRLDITRDGQEVHFRFRGDGFLYHMVRILVGTLLEAGSGRLDPQQIPAIFESQNRVEAGYTVPPHGLFLMEVAY